MKKVVVFGAGLVGRVMALDLSDRYSVTCVDYSKEALRAFEGTRVDGEQADLTKEGSLEGFASSADLVINALPGSFGFSALKRLCEVGSTVVDIAFFSEDPEPLREICKEKGSFAVYDIGVAPGLSNLCVARSAARFDKLERCRILVGGLPVARKYPYEYAAVFSPSDVIEEYVRPARITRGGEIISVPALTEPEFHEVEGIGTLESFLTDGMRSLLYAYDCPVMEEKTLRFPGHREKMMFLREAGFFSLEPVTMRDGTSAVPRELTDKLFREAWKLKPGEKEFTYLEVEVEGESGGKTEIDIYKLLDYFDEEAGYPSMSRTTGFTATATATALLEGKVPPADFYTPERLLQTEEISFDIINSYLSERAVNLRIETCSPSA